MIQLITVATSRHDRLNDLVRSAKQAGMDLIILGQTDSWQGFGTKIILTYRYLKAQTGCTHFIFVDAFDTLVLKPITDVPDQIIFNTEKQKWPDHDIKYPVEYSDDNRWPYLNSGVYMGSVENYIKLIEENPLDFADDDQRYFTKLYLEGKVQIDNGCKYFQSYAFNWPDDFTITDKFINNITKTEPSIIHFNGKCYDQKVYNMVKFQTLADVQSRWADIPERHEEIHKGFIERVNDTGPLNAHRTFVENFVFGFGERSFQWLWWLLIREMPAEFTFMEIGVFKGQTLSLVELISNLQEKKAKRYGVTPLSNEGGVWDSNYANDIRHIHEHFNLSLDYTILHGLSEDEDIIARAQKLSLDILYIDGGHEPRHITNDIDHYSGLVKPGGYMVIDDCCNTFQMPFGYFQGIQAVTDVVDNKLPPAAKNPHWQFICSVVHIRVYKRI